MLPFSSQGTQTVAYRLAFHCAPALAGIKAANLVSLKKSRFPRLREELAVLCASLAQRGIQTRCLRECGERLLLLVYSPPLLQAQLSLPENRQFLEEYGYSSGIDLAQMLARLCTRINSNSGGYPHEIGIFLGYPLADILGFIANGGGNYRLCGYWKVYENPKQAKETFCQYDRARRHYCGQVLVGKQIHHITYGGEFE